MTSKRTVHQPIIERKPGRRPESMAGRPLQADVVRTGRSVSAGQTAAKTRAHSASGFTLLEVLVSVAILSMILAAVYGAFHLAQKALFDVDQSVVRLQETRAFLDILKREIESSRYSRERAYTVFKVDDRDSFGRQTSALTLTTYSPLMSGLSSIHYAVEEKNGILTITKSMKSAFSKTDEEQKTDLLEDIETFELQVKYQNAWVKTWDSTLTQRVPEEVKIAVSMRMKKDSGGDASSGKPCSFVETVKLKAGSAL